ncbi:MAG TPA: AMP-binding protein [Solirubrobacterales bacterium]|nr:AMP-binding protein [Solirubrobacterales bacterium]
MAGGAASAVIRSIEFHARRDPGHECLVDLRPGEAARRFSYAEIEAAIAKLAGGLVAEGVRPGDRVVLRLQNTSDFVVALFACLRAGAIAVPTITQYAGEELRYAVEDCGARCLIFDDPDLEVVGEALVGGVAAFAAGAATGPGIRPLAELAEAAPAPAVPVVEDGDALIFYTSGTTAQPKGVVLSHAAIAGASLINAEGWRLRPDDRSYIVLPLFHCNALFMQLIPALLSGATAILGERYSASAYLDEAREHGITLANLTAGAIRSLLAQPESDRDREHRLRQLTFGLPLHREEIERIEARFGIPVYMCFGLTETSSGGTRSPVHVDPKSGWQSLGVAQPGWQVMIAGEDGPAAAGEVGEILFRGPGVMSRYWERPELTEVALADGWLHTGDLGTLDADGYLFFHSREKDMLKPKGENVAASEIEAALEEHEAIAEAGVVGVFDPHHEERIVAMVVGSEVGEEELREHCLERLAAFKVPKEFVWVEELPKTSIGKINKGAIKSAVEGR